MRSLGISIGRERLCAVLWEQSLLSAKMAGCWEVTCGEPYGTPEDIARLAEEIRRAAGPGALPPAVLSLPPAWTYLRRISLPVSDLPRAKKMHIAELEGNLPIEDEEILSDVLPAVPGEKGTFLAIAARRPAVEKAADAFTAAGFRPDRTITDHVSLLCAVLSDRRGFTGWILSALGDIVVLSLAGGGATTGRQFPEEMADSPEALAGELQEVFEAGTDGQPAHATIVFGSLPGPLMEAVPGPEPFVLPAEAANASPLAYGASLAPFFGRETGGFSLRTSAEAESERTRRRFRVRVAAAAAAVAVVSASGAVGMTQWANARKAARIRAEIRKEFNEAVPGVKVVVQETTQIREKIQALSRQRKELGTDSPEISSLLATVSRAFPKEGAMSVRELSFDAGRLRIAGDAATTQLVEAFRTSLVGAFGAAAKVTVQESEGSAKGGTVRFTILVETGGDGHAS